jgi:hypothetical protein
VGWKGGGGFRFYKLGAPIFDADGNINPAIRFPHLAAHIWFCETKTSCHPPKKKSPLLGIHNGTAYYLLYNGILGDKTVNGGNVLTLPLLKSLPPHNGPKVMNAEEAECAKAIEMLGTRLKYWVRNLERDPRSFRFQTSTDFFYPDFVALLDDGRILVVEYKGAFLRGQDTDEKDNLGLAWAKESKGKCLFLMAWKQDEQGRNVYQQLQDVAAQK